MNRISAVFFAVIATLASGVDLSQTITTPSGIVVHLPAGWQQIPDDVLTALSEEAFGGAVGTDYETLCKSSRPEPSSVCFTRKPGRRWGRVEPTGRLSGRGSGP